jgi:O-methyltransferase involved in polyketide biosynthesis
LRRSFSGSFLARIGHVTSTIGTMTVIDGNTLEGVSATTLWTLHNRATEAGRRGGVLKDPLAVELYNAIDYDYLKFGEPNQSHALRALAFDTVAADYLLERPKASVVALAEGLQTSFWRLDAAGLADELTWYSVDLPPVMALRKQLLPADDRIVNLTQSALDFSWMEQVDSSHGVFVTAEGLLMYLDPADVRSLITACAAHFSDGRMMFDSIPPWFSRRTLDNFKLSDRYHTPPMPFGITPDDAVALAERIPGVHAARDIPHIAGRGMFRMLAWAPFNQIGPLRRGRPGMTLLEFSATGPSAPGR